MSAPAGIVLSGLSRTFAGRGRSVQALRVVSLDCPPGSFTALIGPSGCGKSTILRAALGLEPLDEGRVTIGGQPPSAATRVHVREETRLAGYMELEWARVKWFLSIEVEDLPPGQLAAGKHAYRGLTFDGQDFDFSSGFDDLHTKVYQDILSGGGYGIADARPSIDVVYEVRSRDLSPIDALAHPRVRGA